MGGLALWASGPFRTTPPRPALRTPISQRPSAVPELRRVALRPTAPGPAEALVRAEPPPPVRDPRGNAPSFGRTLARLMLPLIANPTLPRRFGVLAAEADAPPPAPQAIGR